MALGVRFVSLTEALDLTTPAGRAFTGFLAVSLNFSPFVGGQNGQNTRQIPCPSRKRMTVEKTGFRGWKLMP
jgi:hypothetical protein